MGEKSEMLAPLPDLVRECSHNMVTKKKGMEKQSWYWSNMHKKAFDAIKKLLARDVLLAYPTYGEVFEIFTDVSKWQLGAVITQNNVPIAFLAESQVTHN